MSIARLLLVIAVVSASMSCSKSPDGPTGDCHTDNTGTLTLENLSPIGATEDILIDNIVVATIAVNQFVSQTVTAGSHTVVWRISNTTTNACQPAFPSVGVCQTQTLSCSH